MFPWKPAGHSRRRELALKKNDKTCRPKGRNFYKQAFELVASATTSSSPTSTIRKILHGQVAVPNEHMICAFICASDAASLQIK
jgi:ribosomal protein S12